MIGGKLFSDAPTPNRPDQRPRIFPYLAILLLCLAPAPSRAESGSAQPAPASLLTVVAYDIEPFFFLDGGKPSGLEYEILRSFADARGQSLAIVWIEHFDDLLPALLRGEGDLASGTLTITPARQETVEFTIPYFPTLVVLVEPRARHTETVEALAGQRVATLRGTTYESILAGIDEIDIVYGESDLELFRLVTSSEADALATDSGVYLWLAHRFPELDVRFPLSEREFYGFAFRRGDPLRRELNSHIEAIKNDGSYRRFLHNAFSGLGDDWITELTEEILH